MNKHEATELAMRIMQTWRNGPSATIWEEILTPLHQRQAVVAYERLRRSEDHAPSIRAFEATYNALSARPDSDGPITCPGCDGYGWNTVSETHNGIEYTASAPCDYCQRGKDARRTVERIRRQGEAA